MVGETEFPEPKFWVSSHSLQLPPTMCSSLCLFAGSPSTVNCENPEGRGSLRSRLLLPTLCWAALQKKLPFDSRWHLWAAICQPRAMQRMSILAVARQE